MADKTPSGPIQVRMYDVGFGDCFLLTVPYTAAHGGDRHVLIDFGTTGGAGATRMKDIAQDIQKTCSGKLTAVVATHRHRDHISGFATAANGKGTGDIIASLKPDLVVQPWTEHPNAAPDASTAPALKLRALRHLRGLATGQAFAGEVLDRLDARGARVPGEMRFLGENNIGNPSAVKNLIRMGQAAMAEYVNTGYKTSLEKLLPGLTVHVLGPPTLKQTDTIRQQTDKDPAEFWMLQARTLSSLQATPPGPRSQLFPAAQTASLSRAPYHSRWFIRQMDSVQVQQLHSIVRVLDDQMNNTSVILLFELRAQRLLFPGDAQIENWRYALDQKQYKALLRGVTVYKVGHHGSRNATPRTLWDLFARRGDAKKKGRLRTLLSTKSGKHGAVRRNTEVPRQTLVAALKQDSVFKTTEEYKPKEVGLTF